MRRAAPVLLLLTTLALSGCAGSGSGDGAGPADEPRAEATSAAGRFSEDVRTNFLDSCLDNARNTANGAATDAQLSATCACILGKVEQEYSQEEFAEFEQRLVDGSATAEESDRLTGWSTGCAKEATSS